MLSDDYGRLLLRGEVMVRTSEPDAWLDDMRQKARRDRLSIRTGRAANDRNLVWAVRRSDAGRDEPDGAPGLRLVTDQLEVEATARVNGHADITWMVSYEGRAAGRCAACGARAFVDATRDPPVVDGEVIDHECRGGAGS